MTDFTFQNKQYHVYFDWSFLKLHPDREMGQTTFVCYLSSPTMTVADVSIQNPTDHSNTHKGRKIAFERAARRLAAHLYKKNGPRPLKIKNAIISAYNDAVLQENNPELWEQVQQKKAQQKLINDEKRVELKAKNKELKEELKKKKLEELERVMPRPVGKRLTMEDFEE